MNNHIFKCNCGGETKVIIHSCFRPSQNYGAEGIRALVRHSGKEAL